MNGYVRRTKMPKVTPVGILTSETPLPFMRWNFLAKGLIKAFPFHNQPAEGLQNMYHCNIIKLHITLTGSSRNALFLQPSDQGQKIANLFCEHDCKFIYSLKWPLLALCQTCHWVKKMVTTEPVVFVHKLNFWGSTFYFRKLSAVYSLSPPA